MLDSPGLQAEETRSTLITDFRPVDDHLSTGNLANSFWMLFDIFLTSTTGVSSTDKFCMILESRRVCFTSMRIPLAGCRWEVEGRERKNERPLRTRHIDVPLRLHAKPEKHLNFGKWECSRRLSRPSRRVALMRRLLLRKGWRWWWWEEEEARLPWSAAGGGWCNESSPRRKCWKLIFGIVDKSICFKVGSKYILFFDTIFHLVTVTHLPFMTSSLRNSLHRRNHKERSQLAHRAKLGLLEKHADYVKRARDYHSKQDRLTRLKQKATERNKDEFYFSMSKEKTRVFYFPFNFFHNKVDIAHLAGRHTC